MAKASLYISASYSMVADLVTDSSPQIRSHDGDLEYKAYEHDSGPQCGLKDDARSVFGQLTV